MILEIFSSVAASGIVVFLLKNWFIERIRHGIKHEYDVQIERLKAENLKALELLRSDFAREAQIYSVAHRSVGDSLCNFQGKRNESVILLWESFVEFKNSIPELIFVSEMNNSDGRFYSLEEVCAIYGNVTMDDVKKFSKKTEINVERTRIFVGSRVWLLYKLSIKLFHFVVYHFFKCCNDKELLPWHANTGIIHIINLLLSESEKKDFEDIQECKFMRLLSTIEEKFVREAGLLVVGQEVNDLSVQEAVRVTQCIIENSYRMKSLEGEK